MASFSSTLRIYHNVERSEYIVGSKSLTSMRSENKYGRHTSRRVLCVDVGLSLFCSKLALSELVIRVSRQ